MFYKNQSANDRLTIWRDLRQTNFSNVEDHVAEYQSKKLGSSDASVVVMNAISENVNIRNKQLDGSERSDNLAVTLTTYIGKKKASISSSNLNEKNISKLVNRCVEATKITPEDEHNSLPEKELHYTGDKKLDLYDETHLDNEKKIDFIKEAEEYAFESDKIVNTNGSGFSQNKSNFILANSMYGFGQFSSNSIAFL